MAALTGHSRTEDFAAWAFDTAQLLEQRRFDEIDKAALADEARGLARSEYTRLQRQLRKLLLYLLKWDYQTEKRSVPREVRILQARFEIASVLKTSPSLHSKLTAETLAPLWQRACKRAVWEIGLINPLPETCPWDIETQLLNEDWLP
jgi:Domain of unknown function DUF29